MLREEFLVVALGSGPVDFLKYLAEFFLFE